MKETDELLQLKSALEQAEQQNQLLNREYSQLLKEKEVSMLRGVIHINFYLFIG